MSKKWISLLVICLFVAAIVVGGVIYWRHAQIYPSTEDAYVHGDKYSVSSRIPGTILTAPVTENQLIKKGQVIATLDPRDYDQAVQQAEAALAQVQSVLATDRAQILQAEAQIQAAQSELALRKLDLKRFTELIKRQSIPKQKYDQAVTAEQVAEARFTAARKSLSAAEAKQAVDRKGIKTAEVRVSEAELKRSYCTITSPVSGYVSKKSIQDGEVVAPGQPLCAVVPMSGGHVWVDANFKETQLKRIQPGQKVTFHTDVNPDREYRGYVESLSAGTGAAFSLLPPENATGNWVKVVQRLPVRIAVDPKSNQDHSLRLGLSVHVVVDTKSAPVKVEDGRVEKS